MVTYGSDETGMAISVSEEWSLLLGTTCPQVEAKVREGSVTVTP